MTFLSVLLILLNDQSGLWVQYQKKKKKAATTTASRTSWSASVERNRVQKGEVYFEKFVKKL